MTRKPPVVRHKTINGALLDAAAAAAFLGCSERSLRARVCRRLVPYRKLDSRLVFLKAELEQFIHQLPGLSVEEARTNREARPSRSITHK